MDPLDLDLSGRVAVISGAGRDNMGRGAALLFAEHGARVCVTDLDADGAEQTAALVRAQGGAAVGIGADLASEAAAARVADGAAEAFGRVDYVVHFAAAFQPWTGTMDTTTDGWERLWAAGPRASFLLSKHCLRHIRRNEPAGDGDRGAIVCVSSAVAHRGGPNWVAYHSSKAAMFGLVAALAAEGAPHRIRANCLTPGGTRTAYVVVPDQRTEDWIAAAGHTPYIAQPLDQARAALWLCSPSARFLTGCDLHVDGGAVGKGSF